MDLVRPRDFSGNGFGGSEDFVDVRRLHAIMGVETGSHSR